MSTGLTRLIRPLALMALIKNLGRHRVGESSCEDETCRARRRLAVRGGDLSWGIPLVGNWSEIQPSGRNRDILPVWVLTGVLSLTHLGSWT
jgi:hypothetical protein